MKSLRAVLTRITTECSDSDMETFSDIIDAFGGPVEFGLAIGIKTSHARTMKARDSIPASRWMAVADAAAAKGLRAVTIEAMASIEARRDVQ